MKRIFLLLLICLAMMLSLAACGKDDSSNSSDGDDDKQHAHVLIYNAASSATCTEDGNSEYYECSVCKKCYSDALAENEIENTVITATGHTIEHYEAVAKTCTTDGNVEYWACSACKKCFAEDSCATVIDNVIIPAAHDYSDEWSFNKIYHWHEPLCEHDVKGDHAEHSFEESLCTVCGTKEIKETQGLAYARNDDLKSYKITGIGTAFGVNIVIPEYIDGIPVGAIAPEAFKGVKAIESVTIPDSVTSIGSSAFSGCTGLTSVTIGNSVTTIGDDAFSGCSSLTSVTIGNGVTSIGEDTFSGCYRLVEVINKSSLDITAGSWDYGQIGYYAKVVHKGESLIVNKDGYLFITLDDGTNYLVAYTGDDTELILPDNYNGANYVINDCAFFGCDSITSVTIGNSVTSIGDDAFKNCDCLTSVTCPAFSISYIPKTNLRTVVITSGDSIGSYAFLGCSRLTSVTIPDSVTSIGYSAFNNCTSLTSVTIGNGVTSIGEDAFYGCDNLSYNEYDNACYLGNSNNPYIALVKANNASITSCNIHADTKFVLNDAFKNCTGITSVTIGNSVTSIGSYAFYHCNSLTSVTIPDSVTSIGSYAFYNCNRLTSVTIPNSVTSIGNSAFSVCSNLTSVTIGNGVTSIGEDAFYGCDDGLTSVYITDIAKWCSIKFEDADSNPLYYAKNLYLNGNLVTELVIPNGVTSIGIYAFLGCDSLTSVTIPDSVTSIGSGAFYGCDNLSYNEYDNAYYIGNSNNPYIALVKAKNTSITLCNIHADTKFILSAAFSSCTNLTRVTIGNGVTSISDYAFAYCDGLTSVTIPDSVTSIGEYAFDDCTNLTSVTIGNSVTSIGEDAFYGCDNLSYNEYDNACYLGNSNNPYIALVKVKNTSITSCNIHADARFILSGAFKNCTGLTSVTIPDSVTSIGEYAFDSCDSLTSVTFENPNGWWRSYSADATSGTSITGLDNASTAAKYLRSTYYNYYWKRT